MASQRLFMLGVILLLFGVQLRMVDTYVLNERTSRFIDKQISRSRSSSLYTTQPTSLESYDSPFDDLAGDLTSVSAAPQKTLFAAALAGPVADLGGSRADPDPSLLSVVGSPQSGGLQLRLSPQELNH